MEPKPINITLMSFGFKYGPPNANYYFDVGFLKNPAREPKWGFFSKPDAEMSKFLIEQSQAQEFLGKIIPLLEYLAKIDQHQIFAFGCSAGRHRSSLIVEEIGKRLRAKGIQVQIIHRDNNN